MNTDICRLIRDLERRGFRVTRNKHFKITLPGRPGMVTFAVSPSDHRAMHNIRRELRRVFGPEKDTAVV